MTINTTGFEYIIIGIILSVVFSFFSQKKIRIISNNDSIYSSESIVYMVLSCITLWIIPAVRFNVGIDNSNYLMHYQEITSLKDIANYYEPGFGFLNFLCYKIFDNYIAVTFLSSMITGALFWKTFYRDSYYLPLCILTAISVNLYFMSFTVIRQFIAIAIVSQSIPFIKNRKFLPFLIVVLLATSFHYTAFVFSIVYFIYSDNDKILTIKNLTIIISICLFLKYADVVFSSLFTSMSSLREGYSLYEGNDTIKDIREVIFLLPVPIFALIFRKKLIRQNEHNRIYIIMSILLIMTKFIGVISPPLSRLYYYFVFCVPILLSYVPKVVHSATKFIAVLFVCIYIFWSILNIIKYQWEDFLPYYSFFEIL